MVCLKSKYSLKTQLLFSFGTAATVAVFSIVFSAWICLVVIRNTFEEQSTTLFKQQITSRILQSSRHAAEVYRLWGQTVLNVADMLHEIVGDRIVGYPNNGWEEDQYVPFLNMDSPNNSQTSNMYPLRLPPLPLDWELDYANIINSTNKHEYLQERVIYYDSLPSYRRISTVSASYFMQGSCDPSVSDVDSPVYFPNCTDSNNNVTTGGIVFPTSTNKGLYEKSGDIAVLLKPLYESNPEILQLSIYFPNEGAGSVIHYPGTLAHEYVSEGCEWMRDVIYPETNEPFGSEEVIAKCHPNGTVVHPREYNVNEFAWFRDAVTSQIMYAEDEENWFFPRRHSFGTIDDIPVFLVARGVRDKQTNKLSAVVSVVVAIQELSALTLTNRIDQDVDVAIFHAIYGFVYGDTLNIARDFPGTPIFETEFINQDDFDKLRAQLPPSDTVLTEQEADDFFSKVFVYSDSYFYMIYPLDLDTWGWSIVALHRVYYNVYNDIAEINKEFDNQLKQLVWIILGNAVIGLSITFVIIWIVAWSITRPLQHMERVARSIVNHDDTTGAGNTGGNSKTFTRISLADDSKKPNISCRIETEVSKLVKEFDKMIHGFSGTGASKNAIGEIHEVRTKLTWQSEFQNVYKKQSVDSSMITDGRKQTTFLSFKKEMCQRSQADTNNESCTENNNRLSAKHMNTTPCSKTVQAQQRTSSLYPAPPKLHFGSNIYSPRDGRKELAEQLKSYSIHPRRSYLFWLLLISIVMPLLVTILTIWYFSFVHVDGRLENWYNQTRNESFEFEIQTLQATAKSKSDQTESSLGRATRSLHLMARLAGWLHLDAVSMSDSFTVLKSGTEECRNYTQWTFIEDDATDICPFFLNSPPICPCEWHDLHNTTCTKTISNDSNSRSRNYNETTRWLQHRHVFGQRHDIQNNETGARLVATSFGVVPGVDDEPSHTEWWSIGNSNDVYSDMPGSYKRANVSGYSTTYDRVRISSALAVVEIALYNHVILYHSLHPGERRWLIGTMIAFEADGLGTGYRGCDHSYTTDYASFQSTIGNNAAIYSPELCPLGKFGYDPRCRSWYNHTKSLYLQFDKQNRSTTYYTPAYQFVSDDVIGLSASTSVIDPLTDDYIGQVMIDFVLSLRNDINRTDKSKSYVISFDSTERNDTVLGPDGRMVAEPSSVGDLLLPFDDKDSELRKMFDQDVLQKIKNVSNNLDYGTFEFQRTTKENETETVTLAYHYVYARKLKPVAPQNYSYGGAVADQTPVYLACSTVDESSKSENWNKIQLDVYDSATRIRNIFFIVCGVFFVLFCIETFRITMKVTRPMLILLRVVQMINDRMIEYELPPLHGGSREVHQVYSSFAKLVRIVRMSNVAFFSGDLEWAYEFICDALKLFRKIGDEKAEGIACANLGNTLHVMYSNAIYSDDCCTMIPGICCIRSAHHHYGESIALAERQRNDSIDETERHEFAQQLADRLFNRGLFFILVDKEGSCAPENARKLGINDIARVKELDGEVKSYWAQQQLLSEKSGEHFDRLLRRSMGLLRLLHDEELQQLWDVRMLLQEADKFLVELWTVPSASIFHNITRCGRRQQMECVAIQYELLRGKTFEAASSSMRILVEDDYVIEDTFKVMSTSLFEFMRDETSSDCWSNDTKARLRSDLRSMLRTQRGGNNIDIDAGKCFVFAIELNNTRHDDCVLEDIKTQCLTIYDTCCFKDDFVGVVANQQQNEPPLNVSLCLKSENEGILKSSIDLAFVSTIQGSMSIAPYASQMILDSSASTELDSFILLITDGSSFDQTALRDLKHCIEKMNTDEKETKIHLFIIGIDLVDEHVIEEYKAICSTVSKFSTYLESTRTTMDAAFAMLASLLSDPFTGYSYDKGLTMERF